MKNYNEKKKNYQSSFVDDRVESLLELLLEGPARRGAVAAAVARVFFAVAAAASSPLSSLRLLLPLLLFPFHILQFR